MARAAAETPASGTPELTWAVAQLFPLQGQWTEEDYLALHTNHLVEVSDGVLEVLPMPTESHQSIVAYLYGALLAFVAPRRLGKVLFAPLRVRLWQGTIREPDVVFMLEEHRDRRAEKYWQGADLVIEVVSADDPQRDLERKPVEYARGGIPEYWIVNPFTETITVLGLDGGRYVAHGEFRKGEKARSALLEGFEVDVAAAPAG
jgi:Uma2 family endonuclease